MLICSYNNETEGDKQHEGNVMKKEIGPLSIEGIEKCIINIVGLKYVAHGCTWSDLIRVFNSYQNGEDMLKAFQSQLHPHSYEAIKNNLK